MCLNIDYCIFNKQGWIHSYCYEVQQQSHQHMLRHHVGTCQSRTQIQKTVNSRMLNNTRYVDPVRCNSPTSGGYQSRMKISLSVVLPFMNIFTKVKLYRLQPWYERPTHILLTICDISVFCWSSEPVTVSWPPSYLGLASKLRPRTIHKPLPKGLWSCLLYLCLPPCISYYRVEIYNS